MNSARTQRRTRERPHEAARPAWEIFLPPLILIAPLINFLVHHEYSLLKAETELYLALWLGLGIVAGVTMHRSGRMLRLLILTGCLTLFVDIHLDGAHVIGLKKLALISLGLGVGVWVLRIHITRILLVVFATLVVSIVLLPDRIPQLRVSGGDEIAVRPTELAPVILLLLDEHAGVAGIPTAVPGGRETRKRILELYSRHGFRLHHRAYSQYFDTYNAIPNLLNFTTKRKDNFFFEHRGEPRKLRQNRLFAEMADDGYAIRVYQSDYMDLCRSGGVTVELCLTYRRNSIKSIEALELRTGDKLRFIGSSYLLRSAIVFRCKVLYNWIVRLGLPLREVGDGVNRVGPLPTGDALDRLSADVVAAPNGRLFVAHLMNPHYPYVYDEACRIRPDPTSWLGPRNDLLARDAPGGNTDDSRRLRYDAYLSQVRCIQDRLETLFDSMEDHGILDRATVIVQGDHGSRIARVLPEADRLNSLGPDDYVDSFATLFAVRAPGLTAGADEEPISIGRAFARALGRDERTLKTDDVLLVGGKSEQLTPVPMPRF